MNLGKFRQFGFVMLFWCSGVFIGYLFGSPIRTPPSEMPVPAVETSEVAPPVTRKSPMAPPAPLAGVPDDGVPVDYPNGITSRDIEVALEMNERSRKGEFILSMERPTDRKAVQAAIADLVSRMSSNNAPALENLLSTFGLPQPVVEQLQVHQTKIETASLEAEMAIEQLMVARREYDKRIRSALDEEQYAEYLDFEWMRPVVREYEKVKEFGTGHGALLNEELQPEVISFMASFDGLTEKYWHGPYDSLPQPAVTDEVIIARLEEDIAALANKVTGLREKASNFGLPDEVGALLEAYYSERIHAKERTIQGVLARPASAHSMTPVVWPGEIAGAH